MHGHSQFIVAASIISLALGGLAGCPSTAPRSSPPISVKPPAAAPTSPVAAEPTATKLEPPPHFKDWPNPTVALVLTGQQLGYIEPCGCTGLENQKGGLARRHTLVKHLVEERGWPVVPLDVGSQVKRFGKQQELKFAHTAEALRQMGYRAATLGADDLHLSPNDLLSATNPDDKPSLFVSVNVALIDRSLHPHYTIIESGGKRIGVTAVLGAKYEAKLQGDEIVHAPPLEGLKSTCRDLKAKECDLLVLLAHAPLDEARQIAQEVPLFDLVVASGETNLPSRELETVPGAKTRLMQVGLKSMYAGVIGVFDDPAMPLRYESMPLDARLADSPAMLKLLAEYQDQLKELGLEGLGLQPQPHNSGRKFVGSETCGGCHTRAYKKWSSTPHSHATDSLVTPQNSRGGIARHFDPECLSCHVTGWDPQRCFPYESGYLSLEKTPLLKHNGCENCHGPGSAHVAAENGEGDLSDEQRSKLRDGMKLPLASAEQKCVECHDEDNSPDFHQPGAFEKYWKEVEHRGKD